MNYETAQSALTIAATGTLYTAIAYIAAGIFHQIWKKPAPMPIEETVELSIIDSCEPETQAQPEIVEPESLSIIDSVEEAIAPTATAPLRSMTTHQLRKYATTKGFKGAGRWKKAKLLQVLAS